MAARDVEFVKTAVWTSCPLAVGHSLHPINAVIQSKIYLQVQIVMNFVADHYGREVLILHNCPDPMTFV